MDSVPHIQALGGETFGVRLGERRKPDSKTKTTKNDKSNAAETQTASSEAGQVRGIGRKKFDIKMVDSTCARQGKVDLGGAKATETLLTKADRRLEIAPTILAIQLLSRLWCVGGLSAPS